MQSHSNNQRYAESAVLKKVLDTAIAPDLLDQLQSETNFTPATSEAKIEEIDQLLTLIYDMAEIKGSEHPDTLHRLQELVNLYEETCQFSCAEKLLLRLQIAFQRTYGKENIMMSKVWNRLAEILMHEVHYPEAETYYLKSLALIERYYPLPAKPPVHRHQSHRFSQQYKDAKAFHVASTAVATVTDGDGELYSVTSSPTAAAAAASEAKPRDDGHDSDDTKDAKDTKGAKDTTDAKGVPTERTTTTTAAAAKTTSSSVTTSKVPFQSHPSPRITDTDAHAGTKADANDAFVDAKTTAAIHHEDIGLDPAEIDPTLRLYQMYIPVVRGLADIYWHLQRLSDSERCYRRVLPMLFYWHGLQHEETLSAINGLALVLEADQRAAEALELCERSLQDCIALLGPKDPITQTAVSTVARLKETLGMFQEAEAMYRLAITYSTDALGDTHPQSMGLSLSLARLLQRTHQYNASLTVLQALAPRYERLYGAYHLEYLEVVYMQGELCVFLDDYVEARHYYERCYTHRCLLLRTRHHPLVYQAKFAVGKTYHMACSWRHDIALFRANVAQAKELLTYAFYGTIAIYGQAPMTKPLLMLPPSSMEAVSETSESSEVAVSGVSRGSSSSSLMLATEAVEPGPGPRPGPGPAPVGPGTRTNSVRASLGMESLLEAHCDGHSIDRIYQQTGVFRAECLTMARYLGQFYLEYEYYMEADLLYSLLLDVMRQQERVSPEVWRRLFTVEVQAEIYVAYGRVLEQKKQYARAVTLLDHARQCYQRWQQELTQSIDESEREVQCLREELATAETMRPTETVAVGQQALPGRGSTTQRMSPLELTLKRMLVTSKEEQIRQWRVARTEAQAMTEDCQEQYQYAMSLYTLSS